MTNPISRKTAAVAAKLYTDRPPRPPFDPELVGAIDAMMQALPRLLDVGVGPMRELISSGALGGVAADLTFSGKVKIEKRQVPGPAGAPDVTVTLYSPVEQGAPRPLIYNIHGGGMIMGDALIGLPHVLPYVAEGAAVVASIEYRLAPEHPYPAPIEDVYAGLVWAVDNAGELGVNRDNVIVFGGSAGGGLAAAVALMARDRKGPKISHQVLMCPMLDDRMHTVSSHMLLDDAPWDRIDNLWGWTAYLGDRRGGPDVSPYAAPSRATDLAHLPTTYLDTGSSEAFRDEILDYARRLCEAGVLVDLHMWGGGTHGFDELVPTAAISKESLATRDAFFRRALAK